MNITPLIDVVFLLIIFFMLVSNIIAEENVEMIVPRLDEPETIELEAEDKLVVSVALDAPWVPEIRREAPLDIDGRAGFVQLGSQLVYDNLNDLTGLTDQLRQAKAANENVVVLLRADGAVYYGDMQKVYGAVSNAGIQTIHLVAFTEEP